MEWTVDTATQTSAASLHGANERDKALRHRHGRTPFQLRLKFTPEEWRLLGELANASDTSRYNFAKRLIMQHKAG